MSNQYFFFRIEGVLQKIDLDEIVFLEADHNYTRFYINSKKWYMVRTTLEAAMSQLPDNRFLRTHRSFAVSGNLVVQVKRDTVYLGRGQMLVAEVPVSKQYYAALTKQFIIFDSSPAGTKTQQP